LLDCSKISFDILNRLGVAHGCDRQMGGQTDRTAVFAIAWYDDPCYKCSRYV